MTVKSNNNNEKKREFSFIEENILPKKKPYVKKIAAIFCGTVAMAVVFGFVSRLTYQVSDSFFSDPDVDNEVNVEISPSPIPPPPALESPSPSPKSGKAENVNKEKLIYEQMQQASDTIGKSIVTVTCVSEGVDWFNNNYEKTNETFGLVVGRDSDEVFLLVSSSRLQDAKELRVTFSKSVVVDGRIKGKDTELGLGLLSVSRRSIPKEALLKVPDAPLGDYYNLTPGTPIIALGNPNGYLRSVELGMITNRENYAYVTDNKVELFNTDIAENENGDGVIVNLQGEIIGLMTHCFQTGLNKNLNTNLSISYLKPILTQMMQDEPRIYFGIIGADVTAEVSGKLGVEYGIYVSRVKANSPAMKAGIQSGDVITQIDEKDINSMVSFYHILQEYEQKDGITATVKRTGKNEDADKTFEVVLKNRG